jgi:hypothetical protein
VRLARKRRLTVLAPAVFVTATARPARPKLGVYLRLLDAPVPGLYGPSADELP